jgi:hypothetical protein
MNLEDLIIETTEVVISQNEYKRRQIRLIAALLDIANDLYKKETDLLGEVKVDREDVAFKEVA